MSHKDISFLHVLSVYEQLGYLFELPDNHKSHMDILLLRVWTVYAWLRIVYEKSGKHIHNKRAFHLYEELVCVYPFDFQPTISDFSIKKYFGSSLRGLADKNITNKNQL